jgi:hypothetical protein
VLSGGGDEPAGKPIIACRKVQVSAEMVTLEEYEVVRGEGLAAMRQQRLARLFVKAQVSDGLLTVEDLAYLTCLSTAPVKGDLAECRARDIALPTPGPDPSHRPRRVTQGPGRAAVSVGLCSSLRSIGARVTRRTRSRRYLADFRKVAAL